MQTLQSAWFDHKVFRPACAPSLCRNKARAHTAQPYRFPLASDCVWQMFMLHGTLKHQDKFKRFIAACFIHFLVALGKP